MRYVCSIKRSTCLLWQLYRWFPSSHPRPFVALKLPLLALVRPWQATRLISLPSLLATEGTWGIMVEGSPNFK
ncbi:hypothetical protein LZ32DRAFT_344370 [Colletotrichum eremochloae]|nr:hypothetical protein LZ32DRAFT_344370 [Colletotrichum eremochloae]